MTTNYSISGMTCQHCVMSVRDEVCEVAGVDGIDIDLASGRMTVTGNGCEDAAILAAVAEAGYAAAGTAA
jgi:copper chaperone